METRSRVQLVAEIETMSDAELGEQVFSDLERTLRLALNADGERALDVLAKCGLAAGWASYEARVHRHAG